MKSLSILILLSTIAAIVLGVLFAFMPVFAKSENASPAISNSAAQPVAPMTGGSVDVTIEQAPTTASQGQAPAAELSNDPGLALASTFSVSFEKDTASALAVQEAEAQAEALQAEQEAAQAEAETAETAVASLDSFVASVNNGNANQVSGIYVENILAYSVVRQPSGNAAFISSAANEVTQFGLASEYGSQGFLAHNYLAGSDFFNLSSGQTITLVYGDGSTSLYRIDSIRRFQALQPDSTQSSFVDLESGGQLSASNLFHNMYNSNNSLVLQTCIANDGISTWGRLFIIAVPLS